LVHQGRGKRRHEAMEGKLMLIDLKRQSKTLADRLTVLRGYL
jgi:hypothetical protein